MKEDVVAGFAVRKDYVGQKDFDQVYKNVELKKKLVGIGQRNADGDYEDYVEEVVEIVTETPIKDVIAAQNDSCGLEAYLRPYRMAGELPPEVEVSNDVQDFTIFDGSDDLRSSGSVEKLFASLPVELQQEYGTPEKLLRSFTDDALKAFVEKAVSEKMKKPEEKIEEEK